VKEKICVTGLALCSSPGVSPPQPLGEAGQALDSVWSGGEFIMLRGESCLATAHHCLDHCFPEVGSSPKSRPLFLLAAGIQVNVKSK